MFWLIEYYSIHCIHRKLQLQIFNPSHPTGLTDLTKDALLSKSTISTWSYSETSGLNLVSCGTRDPIRKGVGHVARSQPRSMLEIDVEMNRLQKNSTSKTIRIRLFWINYTFKNFIKHLCLFYKFEHFSALYSNTLFRKFSWFLISITFINLIRWILQGK